MIKYETLKDPDMGGLVYESVPRKMLWPYPLEIVAVPKQGDIVDAWYKEAWWIGRLIHRVENLFAVYFDRSDEYHFIKRSKFRIHQKCTTEDPTCWVYYRNYYTMY
ncbi:hypothetical protein L2E82_10508 [Cichorium intybus]|uniref:Uncharacterized protein n=1 Tax=Cichorium intybus TaxID=13427 RepID=A0ACB9GBS4_CICIN|nr:hypothetical protein L2E82_10508 [Cichorium intybus]